MKVLAVIALIRYHRHRTRGDFRKESRGPKQRHRIECMDSYGVEEDGTSEAVRKAISLPLPGSAERMKEEARREAFREAVKIAELFGSSATSAKFIVEKLLAACPEKGEGDE